MNHVAAPYGLPTPPSSPPPCYPLLPLPPTLPQARLVTPEERIGRILEGRLQLTGILGTGAYGVVYQAVDLGTHQRYAVKTLSKFNSDGTPLDRRQMDFQTREIQLHYRASTHANVVSILRILDEPDCVFVVLEFCPEGDLFFNITECGQYVGKDALAKKVFLQILDAVQHCHSLGIYHRDLKPENILVSDCGETVKLADFGLATSSIQSEDYGCGSTFYMSPECLDPSSKRPFYLCAPNDVWSLGVVLVNLTCGRNPWKQASTEDSTYRAFARSPGFLKTILPVSDQLNAILARIFAANPDQRITLPELRQMILECPRFTEQPTMNAYTPPASPEPTEYVTATYEAAADFDCEPASDDDCLSDGGSTSSDVSLASSRSSLDEDFRPEREAMTPPPQQEVQFEILDAEEPRMVYQDFVPYQCAPPEPPVILQHPVPIAPPQACGPPQSCGSRFFPSNVWQWMGTIAPPVPTVHYVPPFHHAMPRISVFAA